MKLSDDETEAVLYCVTELVDRRARSNVPVPSWMRSLALRFDVAALTREMSPSGHAFDSGAAESEMSVTLGTREAAAYLGYTPRHVRRLVGDLEGKLVNGRMQFKRSVVVAYAKDKLDG